MTAEPGLDDSDTVPARPRRLRRFIARGLLGAVAVTVLATGLAWWQRRPIADDFIRRELTKYGVEAHYKVAEIGLARQRLTNVVIGDPAHPDLVADWIEVGTSLGWGTADVTGIRTGRVRMRARLGADGTVSFGAIDKLLPPPSGKPFALPAMFVELGDARMRLEAPQGVIGLKLTGKGRLDDGFSGRLAATSNRLDFGGCTVDHPTAYITLAITDAQPTMAGPVRAGTVACGDALIERPVLAIDAKLGDRFDRWDGKARFIADAAGMAGARARILDGSISFAGSAAATAGSVRLSSGVFAAPDLAGSSLSIDGQYGAGMRGNHFDGSVAAKGASIGPALRRSIAGIDGAGRGTPVAPLIARLIRAVRQAGEAFDIDATLTADQSGDGGLVKVERLNAASASGASALLSGGRGVQYGWPATGLTVNGLLSLSGGGLPEGVIQLAQSGARRPITGTALLRPYAADGAQLALTPVEFSAGSGGITRISTTATLSGPLGNGRVDGLSMPIDARWNGAGVLAVNPECTTLGWRSLSISSLSLDPAKIRLCPSSGALLRIDGGRVSGGADLATAALTGRIGSTPLSLKASGSQLRLSDYGFRLSAVETVLGTGDDPTRLNLGMLDGRIDGGAVAGTFAAGAGKIAHVPLLISNGVGDWRFAGGKLNVGATLDVADAAETPRFEPLQSRDFTLSLIDNRIAAAGTLVNREKGVKVADVTIGHDLGNTTGSARLDVPGINFDPEGLKPDDLTKLTLGVIAAVKGRVSGHGDIAWTANGVTSSGTFATAGTDLAAAFGPVTGLSGEVHFSDLLGLETPPGQVVTLAEVNPGIAVTGGTITYRLLPNQRVQIEGGRWPLAGGELTLDPTVLDFAADRDRHMTFRVKGVDAGLFLQQFEFENLNATGTFDGVLPMVFDQSGGNIVDGHLQVREGGGTLAYIGEVSKENLGTWGNFAFDALKALRYDRLDIVLNGPIAGEMVTQIRFAGVGQGEGTKSNFIIRRLAKLPLVFNIRVEAPFRQLLDSVQSVYDPSRLIERNLPALLQEQARHQSEADKPVDAPPAPVPPAPIQSDTDRSVQPTESETVP